MRCVFTVQSMRVKSEELLCARLPLSANIIHLSHHKFVGFPVGTNHGDRQHRTQRSNNLGLALVESTLRAKDRDDK